MTGLCLLTTEGKEGEEEGEKRGREERKGEEEREEERTVNNENLGYITIVVIHIP